ncbi:amidohydrolase [Amphibacillus indicireducens]|uniref:Amidohydrolase n=1 Tax=Amphibacillus indicireducens TaxID=1076330 RepID=A0ABP7W4F8_9BACI
MKKLITMLEERYDEMIQIRRHLHQYPELSFQEKNTATYIENFYQGKAVDMETNVGNGYGIIVTIKGGKPGKTVALRADFDALPIQEEADVPFKSKNKGVMHACGHDAHTAYLLVLADCLIELKDELAGTIKIIHQHAEELPPGGAKSIVDSGHLNDVEAIFGIHVLPIAPAGMVGYRSEYAFNGRSYFKLKINATGGHGSSPHKANDAIVAGAHFVTAIQTIVSRRIDPNEIAVMTIGSFDGKGTFNVIKDSIEIEGDIRYSNYETEQVIKKELVRIVDGLEAMFGVDNQLTYKPDYPPLYNDPELTDFVANTLNQVNDQDIKAVREIARLSPSEDFAYYTEKIPGSYFFIGCSPKGVDQPYFNHHPKFDIDENALLVAAKSVGYVVTNYLS